MTTLPFEEDTMDIEEETFEEDFDNDEAFDEDYSDDELASYSQRITELLAPLPRELNATATKKLAKYGEEWNKFLASVVRSGDEGEYDSRATYKLFQSWEATPGTLYTIADLLDAAVFQAQHEIDPARISFILADGDQGLLDVEALLERPNVLINPLTNEASLVGGHHRLATLIFLLKRAGLSTAEIIDQEVMCYKRTIDKSKLLGGKSTGELAGKLASALWLTTNSSRKVSREEKTDFSYSKSGLDPWDSEQLRKAHHLSVGERVIALARLTMASHGFIDHRRTRRYEPAQAVMEINGVEQTVPIRLTLQASSNLIKSFYSKLKGIKEEITVGEKEKNVVVWSRDLKDIDASLRIWDYVIESHIIQDALLSWSQESESLNMAREYSKLAEIMVGYFADSDIEPLDDPRKIAVKTGKVVSRKSSTTPSRLMRAFNDGI